LTVVASSIAGLPLTFTVNPKSGITFSPISGQPAGTAEWAFVY
jgi:hypothetical protein